MEYARSEDHELLTIFKDEGVSGGIEDRPGLVELFNHLEDDPSLDGVLIFKLDRLARDLYIQEHLIRKVEDLNKRILSVRSRCNPQVCSTPLWSLC